MIKDNYKKIMGDSLYRNSIYLMTSTLIMSFLGFVFWMIATRLYSTENIGLTTSIISIMALITGFSVVGLNVGLIRYLPKSKDRNNKINTCFSLVTLIAVVVTTIFLLFLGVFSPKLLFIKESLFLSFGFIFFMVVSSWSSLIDSVFVAYRNTKYILLKNSIFSSLKILIPLLFMILGIVGIFSWLANRFEGVGNVGAYGLFEAWMFSMLIALIVSLFILAKKFGFKPKVVFHDSIIKEMGKYSFGNYVAGFVGGLPMMILPIIILNNLGADSAAFYYISMMIATLLFTVSQATSQSLFAEGSYNEKDLGKQIRKAVKIISLLLIPGILFILFFGQYILLLFGKEYSVEGFRFLQILAVSGIFVGGNRLFGMIFRVKKMIKELLIVSFIGAISIIGLTYLFLDKSLLGIGLAWIIGQGIIGLTYLVLNFRGHANQK